MWPWEHAAFGYLLYSAGEHVVRRVPPAGQPVLALAAATQLPDLIDKPLSWLFGVFPSGFSVAHSVFVAVPLIALLLALGARRGRRDLGVAFAVGYGSHLLGDVIYPVRQGAGPDLDRVLWPLVAHSPYPERLGLVGRTLAYLDTLVGSLADGELTTALLLSIAISLVAGSLWVLDGMPGLRSVRDYVADRLRGDRRGPGSPP